MSRFVLICRTLTISLLLRLSSVEAAEIPEYRPQYSKYHPRFPTPIRDLPTVKHVESSILDAGTGAGRLSPEMTARLNDITPLEFAAKPRKLATFPREANVHRSVQTRFPDDPGNTVKNLNWRGSFPDEAPNLKDIVPDPYDMSQPYYEKPTTKNYKWKGRLVDMRRRECKPDKRNGAGRHGSTLKRSGVGSMFECRRECFATKGCVAVNFRRTPFKNKKKEKQGRCFLKSKVPEYGYNKRNKTSKTVKVKTGFDSCVMLKDESPWPPIPRKYPSRNG